MIIDYNTLTAEELEKYVEFIDWSMVPPYLITKEIRTKFNSIPQLQARLHLEDLFSKMENKQDQEKYPDCIFFFIEEDCYMELTLKNGNLWCSFEKIWFDIKEKTGYDFEGIELFIKNIFHFYFKFKYRDVNPKQNSLAMIHLIELHFNKKENKKEEQSIW